MATAPISVLLPWTNPTHPVPRLSEWIAVLDRLERPYEVLLIPSGPGIPQTGATGQENSPSVAEALPASESLPRQARLLAPTASGGLGEALRAGLAAAQFPLCCYTDGSGCYQPADLARLLELIDQVDLVSGYRISKGTARPSGRERITRFLARWLFGVRLKDVDCAFKLCRRSIFRRIPIQAESDFVHTEIVAKANFLGCLLTELEVHFDAPPPGRRAEESLRPWLQDAARVFRQPDFGPPFLDAEPPGSAASSEIQPPVQPSSPASA